MSYSQSRRAGILSVYRIKDINTILSYQSKPASEKPKISDLERPAKHPVSACLLPVRRTGTYTENIIE